MTDDRRVKFLENFDYKPQPQITIAYQKDDVTLVHRACAEQAVAKGKAEYTTLKPPASGIAARIARKVKKDGQK